MYALQLRIYVSRLGIFAGFAAFFMMEKTLRVLAGGSESGHSHSHSHSHSNSHEPTDTGGYTDKKTDEPIDEAKAKGPSVLSAYLNLFGDFVHNMSVLPLPSSPF